MDFSLCMFANSLLNWFNSNYKRTFQFSFSFWSHETMPATKIPTWIFPYRNSIERRLLMMIWYVCFGQMTSQLEWNIQIIPITFISEYMEFAQMSQKRIIESRERWRNVTVNPFHCFRVRLLMEKTATTIFEMRVWFSRHFEPYLSR